MFSVQNVSRCLSVAKRSWSRTYFVGFCVIFGVTGPKKEKKEITNWDITKCVCFAFCVRAANVINIKYTPCLTAFSCVPKPQQMARSHIEPAPTPPSNRACHATQQCQVNFFSSLLFPAASSRCARHRSDHRSK